MEEGDRKGRRRTDVLFRLGPPRKSFPDRGGCETGCQVTTAVTLVSVVLPRPRTEPELHLSSLLFSIKGFVVSVDFRSYRRPPIVVTIKLDVQDSRPQPTSF